MRLEFWGHACFELDAGGKKILFDPYEPGSYEGAVGYRKITVAPDIILASHKHPDHCGLSQFTGGYKLIDKEGETTVDGIKIIGVKTYHDENRGAQRGENILFSVICDCITVLHCGDVGVVDPVLKDAVAKADVILLPIGGFFTIGAKQAIDLIRESNGPKLFVPMHYKTEKLGFPIAPIDEFIKMLQESGDAEIQAANSTYLDIDKPAPGKSVAVLKHKG